MHYLAYVLIPADGDPATLVEEIMKPYSEHDESNEELIWDWYKIGGRWTDKLHGDVVSCPVVLSDDLLPYALFSKDGVLLKEIFLPDGPPYLKKVEDFAAKVKSACQNHIGRLVVVDYHS
jgi:hypothetical protein